MNSELQGRLCVTLLLEEDNAQFNVRREWNISYKPQIQAFTEDPSRQQEETYMFEMER